MYAYYPARKRISASVSPVPAVQKKESGNFIRLLLRLRRERTFSSSRESPLSDSDLC